MTVRRLDANGDLVTQGQQFINEIHEVEQTVRTRLNLFLGEYFRDVTDGTPWYEQILGKFASLSAAEAALRARIANTPDVIRITRFDSQFDIATRSYDVQADILTVYGEGSIALTDPFGPVDPTPIVPVVEEVMVINEFAVVL